MKKIIVFLCTLFLLIGVVQTASAGRIVLANDEWTLSDSGYFNPNDPAVFATNVASWFTGGSSGNFLAYSTNFGLTGTGLASTMTAGGHSWTVSTAIDLSTLGSYDAVFLSGNALDNTLLTNYVNTGGNVYLAGGTGWGGAAIEAARWNPFLNNFGLAFGTFYNGVKGSIEINSSHELFNGVDHLYQNNGNDALAILTIGSNADVLVSSNGHGLYAVYDSTSTVPEPATMLLLGTSLICLAGLRRRFKK